MVILTELQNKNVAIIKTSHFFRGFYSTPKGVVITPKESKSDHGIYFLSNSKERIFPCSDRIVYITTGTEYEGKIKSAQKAEELAKEGKILSFKSSDLYSEYYNFADNKDLESCFKHGYSFRSRQYIKEVMKSIGLINYTDASNGSMDKDGEPTDFRIESVYGLFFNANTEVGKVNASIWIAQTCYQIEIDDFVVIKMYFSHKPSTKDLLTAFTIRKFESNPIEVFTCWECGHMVNWLELEGDIIKKREMSEEKYCGC